MRYTKSNSNLTYNSFYAGTAEGGVEAPEEYKIKSQSFTNFLERQGYNSKNWRKVVEKWAAPDGTIYQRHYWTNGTDYYYHGDGIEEFYPH